jgi:soluble lytic murein transglycosylase
VKEILLFILFTLTLYSDAFNPSFKEIEIMPSSYSKDYYIWRLLQKKETTKKEALTAYEWTKRKSYKLKKAIRKKVGYIPTKKDSTKKKNPNNFIIYPSTAGKKRSKSLKQIKNLYNKIKKQGKYSEVLQVFTADKPHEELKNLPIKTQLYILNSTNSKYYKKYFNHAFTENQLKMFLKEKQFNKTIFKIITTHKLQKSKKSLIFDSGINNLAFESNFLLAMNAIEFKKVNHAINFLSIARTKTTKQSKYDQVDFWLYLLTHYNGFLDKLVESNQVNIYTLKARDILKKSYPRVLSPVLENREIKDFNITNPIDWEKIKIAMKKNPNKLEKLAKKYKSAETLGVYTYIKEKATKYTVPYYPMPYPDAMKGFNPQRKAILYAIARQESRFVPASVSTSYALGMMQIMPFLIKHLSKERNEKMDLNKMFDPRIAISYANQHMDYLTSWLYHPLFVAYAYNGGIGFTKRRLRTKYLFKKGKYEPYLSMELIDYRESREYAKKVLANYVIYLNLLGIPTKISPLLEVLHYPSQTDRFRK